MNLLLSLLIFSLPLGVLSRINLYPDVYFYLHDVFALAIFMLFLVRVFKKKISFGPNKMLKMYLGFVLIGFFALVINLRFLNPTTFLVSISYLLRYIAYSSIIFVFTSQDSKLFKNLNIKLLIAGLVFIILGYVQFFFYPNLRNLYYAGWDDHLYRLFSTMLDPNFAGVFIALITILGLVNLMDSLSKKDKIGALVLGTFDLLLVIAIYLTHSRSAIISLLFGVVALLIMEKKIKAIFPLILVVVIGFFLFSNFKTEGLNPLRIASAEARIDSANEAKAIFMKNPLLGVGFNSYRYAQIRYGFRKTSIIPTNADAGTDNSYLFVLVTTGIVGFFFFAKFIIEVYASLRALSKNKEILVRAALPSFITILISSFFINVLFYPLIISWVFVLIGVTVSRRR